VRKIWNLQENEMKTLKWTMALAVLGLPVVGMTGCADSPADRQAHEVRKQGRMRKTPETAPTKLLRTYGMQQIMLPTAFGMRMARRSSAKQTPKPVKMSLMPLKLQANAKRTLLKRQARTKLTPSRIAAKTKLMPLRPTIDSVGNLT